MQQAFISEDNKLVRLIVEPGYRWLRHVLLCLLLLTVSYQNIIITFSDDLKVLGWAVPILVLIQFALYLSFYINIYVLVPRFFMQGRYVGYGISLWVLLSINFVCSYYLEIGVSHLFSLDPSTTSYANSSRSIVIDYLSLVSVSGMCCIGTTISLLFRNWIIDGKRKEEMETEQQRKRILKFKDTVNPVFLSDTLSVAAGKTHVDAGASENILIRLSRFLRYRLYDSGREVVFLHSEVAYLENYLSLVADLRSGFTYSVQCELKTGRTVLPPALMTSITDAVLNNVTESLPLSLTIVFLTDDEPGIVMNMTAHSPGTPPVNFMQEILRNILDISYPSGYDLSVRGGGGMLYIHARLNKSRAI